MRMKEKNINIVNKLIIEMFYRLYRFSYPRYGKKMSLFVAYTYLTFLMLTNLSVIIFFVRKRFYGIEYGFNMIQTTIFITILFVYNYFILLRKRRYLDIFLSVRRVTPIKVVVSVILYVLFTIMLPLILFV